MSSIGADDAVHEEDAPEGSLDKAKAPDVIVKDDVTDTPARSKRSAETAASLPESSNEVVQKKQRHQPVKRSPVYDIPLYTQYLQRADLTRHDQTGLWEDKSSEDKQFRRPFRMPYKCFDELCTLYKGKFLENRLGICNESPYDIKVLVLGALRVLASFTDTITLQLLTRIPAETNASFFKMFIGWVSSDLLEERIEEKPRRKVTAVYKHGSLKQRFQILQRTAHFQDPDTVDQDPDSIDQIFKTCCVLHNIIREHDGYDM